MRPGKCIRIYLSESDRIDGQPAMEAILTLCKEAGLRGVSVLRATEGLGTHGVHSTAFLSLSSDLPLLVEAIDTEERITHALEIMQPHLGPHLVAVWPVALMRGSWEDNDA
jgi:uncharacterized protein